MELTDSNLNIESKGLPNPSREEPEEFENTEADEQAIRTLKKITNPEVFEIKIPGFHCVLESSTFDAAQLINLFLQLHAILKDPSPNKQPLGIA